MQTAHALTSIPLIAIEIQIISGRRRFDTLVVLNGVHPARPSTAGLRLGPATVGHKDLPESDDPRRKLNVHERDVRAEEEGA